MNPAPRFPFDPPAELDVAAVARAVRGTRDQFPIVTVYEHPTDAPEHYVARIFLAAGGPTPTAHAWRAKDVDLIREALTKAGLIRLARQIGDDPVILETWL